MSGSDSDHSRQKCLYEDWMNQQEEEVIELQQAARSHVHGSGGDTHELEQLVRKVMLHFEDHIEQRKLLARKDVTPYLAPSWITRLENSALWIGGNRPSSYIRLVYVLCGLDIESHLAEFLRGSSTGNIGDLSGPQIEQLDKLQREIVRKENDLSSKIASLQEDMVEKPLAMIGRKSSRNCHHKEDVHQALDEQEDSMASVFEEADQLRLNTNKEIIDILTPAQCVDFLAAGKKLILCMQEWGRKRDHDHGRDLV